MQSIQNLKVIHVYFKQVKIHDIFRLHCNKIYKSTGVECSVCHGIHGILTY